MNIRQYKHKRRTNKPNRFALEINEFALDEEGIKEFNAIYQYCKANYRRVEATNSEAIPYNNAFKNYFRYCVIITSTRFELDLIAKEGCYRWTIGSKPVNEKENAISGKKAVRQVYALARKLKIDLTPYASSVEEGRKIKETILSPLIEEYCLKGVLQYKMIEDGKVHHLDLNSSYASRICEVVEELKPLYQYLFDKRHEDDNFYKHVLTNHIGCWQSLFCPKYHDSRKCSPYQFAKLSKIAIDNTRHLIEHYLKKLIENGRTPLLTNTDGIWYHGELFHDEFEGEGLGKRHHDHINCNILIKSKGAYQYQENGITYTIVRGRTNLDTILDRTERKFGQILDDELILKQYGWDNDKGVITNYGKI